MNETYFEAQIDGDIDSVPRMKQTLRTIKEVITEAEFVLSDTGISMKSTDAALVGLINMELWEEFFTEVELHAKDNLVVGVNVEELYRAVRKANAGDTLVIRYGDNKDDDPVYEVEVESEILEFKSQVPVLNLDDEANTDADELSNFGMVAEFSEDKTKSIVKHLKDGAGATFAFDPGEEVLEIHQESDHDVRDLRLRPDNVEESGEARTNLSMDYLSNVIDGNLITAAAQDNPLKFSLGTDYPFKLSFSDEAMDFVFVLAPRIEEE